MYALGARGCMWAREQSLRRVGRGHAQIYCIGNTRLVKEMVGRILYTPVDMVKHHEKANIFAPVELTPSEPCSTLAMFSLLVCFGGALAEEDSNGFREVEDGGHLEGCGETTPGTTRSARNLYTRLGRCLN